MTRSTSRRLLGTALAFVQLLAVSAATGADRHALPDTAVHVEADADDRCAPAHSELECLLCRIAALDDDAAAPDPLAPFDPFAATPLAAMAAAAAGIAAPFPAHPPRAPPTA